MKSTVTQFIFRSSRKPDGSQGPATAFFATEAHPPGYEAFSNDIATAHAPGESEADGKSVLAQMLFGFGVGTLIFRETERTLSSDDGCVVEFASSRKLADGESFAGSTSASSDLSD